MTTQVLTGLLLLVLPVAYNLLYTLLARSFDYPDILRQPTDQVLDQSAHRPGSGHPTTSSPGSRRWSWS